MEIERQTVTVEEAATILGVGRNKAYEAARSGEVPTIRIGKRLLVPLTALERLLAVGAQPLGANDGSAGKAAPLAEEEERRCRRARIKPNPRRPNRESNCKRHEAEP